MIITYYTLYLLLFDNMLQSRVEKSASYRRRLGKIHITLRCCRLNELACESNESDWVCTNLWSGDFQHNLPLLSGVRHLSLDCIRNRAEVNLRSCHIMVYYFPIRPVL